MLPENLKDKFIISRAFRVELTLQKRTYFGIMIGVILFAVIARL